MHSISPPTPRFTLWGLGSSRKSAVSLKTATGAARGTSLNIDDMLGLEDALCFILQKKTPELLIAEKSRFYRSSRWTRISPSSWFEQWRVGGVKLTNRNARSTSWPPRSSQPCCNVRQVEREKGDSDKTACNDQLQALWKDWHKNVQIVIGRGRVVSDSTGNL